jgi:hypothetical protein
VSIWGWVAIGIVVLALILLAVVALGTMRRLLSLKTVMEGNRDSMLAEIAPVQAKIAGLQGDLEEVQQRVQIAQERLAQVKG